MMKSKLPTPFNPRATETYGGLLESVHIAGYTFERACTKLEWLLAEESRWQSVGYTDVNAFMDSIRLDNLKSTAEQRKRIALKIKQYQPKVSNRQIAKTLGVAGETIDRDVATNVAPAGKNVNLSKGGKHSPATNVAPTLSGAVAAKTVERAGRVRNHQASVNDRVAKVVFDAKKLGKFTLILADPLWDDEFGANQRSTENHYPTMSLDAICALPVDEIAHDQAMLFLWATTPMLELALQVVKAWGFDYRTHMVWVKPSIGTGKYVRQPHELLLICRRGEHPAPNATTLPDSVMEAPRGAHSEKRVRSLKSLNGCIRTQNESNCFGAARRERIGPLGALRLNRRPPNEADDRAHRPGAHRARAGRRTVARLGPQWPSPLHDHDRQRRHQPLLRRARPHHHDEQRHHRVLRSARQAHRLRNNAGFYRPRNYR
jgi:N6-adenosine-specific RNA methylase IME4